MVLRGFLKDGPPLREKLPVEVDIPEWLFMKVSGNYSTWHEWASGDWALILFYFLLKIGEYEITSDMNQMQ